MSTPARLHRAYADEILHRDRATTFKESDRERRILDVAEGLMIRYGRGEITMTALASAMLMSPMTIRRQFADMEEVLSAICLRYLKRLETALAKIPPDDPQAPRARRAAYLAFTRTGIGAHTDIHHLLITESPCLPADLASTIENTRCALAAGLFGPGAHRTTLGLLDSLELNGPAIEAMLATLETLLRPETPAAAAEPAAPIILRLRGPEALDGIEEPAAPAQRHPSRQPPTPPRPATEARAGPG